MENFHLPPTLLAGNALAGLSHEFAFPDTYRLPNMQPCVEDGDRYLFEDGISRITQGNVASPQTAASHGDLFQLMEMMGVTLTTRFFESVPGCTSNAVLYKPVSSRIKSLQDSALKDVATYDCGISSCFSEWLDEAGLNGMIMVFRCPTAALNAYLAPISAMSFLSNHLTLFAFTGAALFSNLLAANYFIKADPVETKVFVLSPLARYNLIHDLAGRRAKKPVFVHRENTQDVQEAMRQYPNYRTIRLTQEFNAGLGGSHVHPIELLANDILRLKP